MTHSQKSTVKAIRNYIEKTAVYSSEYEFKRWEVEEFDYGVVCVYAVCGLKNDEGTVAAVLCRDKWQVFIGKRGAVHGYKGSKTIKGNFFEVMSGLRNS